MKIRSGLVLVGCFALGGCVESRTHLGADFGYAVDQAVVAQIADPDARYRGTHAPGSDGARVGLAQERYRTGKVTAPSATASTINSTASSGGGPQ